MLAGLQDGGRLADCHFPPRTQTCRGSPLCPAEHLTTRISPARGPPVWRPSSPRDTSPPTGDVSLQCMGRGVYGASPGSWPRVTTKSCRPSNPWFSSCPKDHAEPQSSSCFGISRAQSMSCSKAGPPAALGSWHTQAASLLTAPPALEGLEKRSRSSASCRVLWHASE